MYPRVEYKLSEEDLKALLEACRPTLAMKIGEYVSRTPQENANAAWEALGKKMGFNSMTVRPVPGKSNAFFTAIPSETHEQKIEREAKELKEKKQSEIKLLKGQIDQLQSRLKLLLE